MGTSPGVKEGYGATWSTCLAEEWQLATSNSGAGTCLELKGQHGRRVSPKEEETSMCYISTQVYLGNKALPVFWEDQEPQDTRVELEFLT